MTGYRRALGRSRVPRRYVPWSEKAFYLEQSKKKIQIDGTKGSSSATRNSFCQEHPQSSKRRFWRWHALQQYPRSPMGPAAWIREREMVNRVQLESELPFQKHKLHRRQQGSSCQEEFTSGDQWDWRGTGTRTSVLCARKISLNQFSRPEKSNSNHVNN